MTGGWTAGRAFSGRAGLLIRVTTPLTPGSAHTDVVADVYGGTDNEVRERARLIEQAPAMAALVEDAAALEHAAHNLDHGKGCAWKALPPHERARLVACNCGLQDVNRVAQNACALLARIAGEVTP